MKTKRKRTHRKVKQGRKFFERGKISLGFLIVGLLAIAVIPTVLLSQNRVTTDPRASGREVATDSAHLNDKASPCSPLGDVNGDGYVTSADAQEILRFIVRFVEPTDEDVARGHVTAAEPTKYQVPAGEKFSVVDALFIGRYATGTDSILKGCPGYFMPSPTPTISLRRR